MTRTGPDFWINGFATYDRRRVLRNAFVSGTAADAGDGGWRDVRQIALEPNVTEYAFGGAMGIASAAFTAQIVTRTKEYVPGGGLHRFGSVTLTLFTPGSAK